MLEYLFFKKTILVYLNILWRHYLSNTIGIQLLYVSYIEQRPSLSSNCFWNITVWLQSHTPMWHHSRTKVLIFQLKHMLSRGPESPALHFVFPTMRIGITCIYHQDWNNCFSEGKEERKRVNYFFFFFFNKRGFYYQHKLYLTRCMLTHGHFLIV